MQKNTIWYASAGALVVLSAVALFISWRANHRQVAPPVATTTTAPIPPSTGIANPVPVPSGLTAAPLPPLESSDKPVHDSLADLFGAKCVDELFRPETLMRHLVVTVDNLPRKHLSIDLRPTKALPGIPSVAAMTVPPSIRPTTSAMTPMCTCCRDLNVQQFTTLYFHYYPLFQQSYESLGYPNGYFNDRLVATIDDALAAPDVQRTGGADTPQRDVSVRRSKDRVAVVRPEAHGAAGSG